MAVGIADLHVLAEISAEAPQVARDVAGRGRLLAVFGVGEQGTSIAAVTASTRRKRSSRRGMIGAVNSG
jgi:hypothetical protein